MRTVAPLLVALPVLMRAAAAEPVYVVEQILVNVASTPGGERIATVRSGDRLELLERQQDAAHIRLANGTEGWVKASYLSSEPPLQQRLGERTLEADKLKQEVAQLQAQVSRLQGQLSDARLASSGTPDGPPVATAMATPAAPPLASTASQAVRAIPTAPSDPTRPIAWQWLLGAAALMLLVGFVAGWRVLDGRIRKKYGGLRIY